MIQTRWHAFLDYMMVLVLLTAPWVLDFSHIEPAKTISLVAGAFILLLSLITKHEGGILRIVPMRLHLILDIVLGGMLIVAPFALGFTGVYVPHLIVGMLLVCAGLFTYRKPQKNAPPIDIPKNQRNLDSAE